MSGFLRSVFGLDDAYERPTPPRWWVGDLAIALLMTVLTLALVMTNRVNPELAEFFPLYPSLAAALSAGVLLAIRRRFPIAVMLLLTGLHFIVVGVLLPVVASLASLQIVYFLGIYTAMAYAKRRGTLAASVLTVYFAMAVWLVLFDLYGRAFMPEDFQPNFWHYVSTVLINLAFFGGATWLGRNSWLQAKATDELAESAETVRRQGDQLAEQAVVSERLRIARDLHDSVAHHISLIGIQTAAARRAMATKPEAATEAMLGVEEMAREAVADLRNVLGTLRESDAQAPAVHSLDALDALCRDANWDGLTVAYSQIGLGAEERELTAAQVNALVRVTQEALTNVRRHSTASEARVVLRADRDKVELEITDNGRHVPNTSGSGLGHVGMRERLTALGGSVELGPRSTQGYRVLARLPRYHA